MKATIEFVKEKYQEFNRLIFEDKLPTVPLRVGHARTSLGTCRFNKRRRLLGGYEAYGFRISISDYFDLPQEIIEDTIIHEMIHYYIWHNGIKDTSAHGKEFRRMMKNINSTYNRHLTISYRKPTSQLK